MKNFIFPLLILTISLLVSCDEQKSPVPPKPDFTTIPARTAGDYAALYRDIDSLKPLGIKLSYDELSKLLANSPTDGQYSIIFGAKSASELVPMFRVYDPVSKTENFYELKNTILCPPPTSCDLGISYTATVAKKDVDSLK